MFIRDGTARTRYSYEGITLAATASAFITQANGQGRPAVAQRRRQHHHVSDAWPDHHDCGGDCRIGEFARGTVANQLASTVGHIPPTV